jgi:hypothetical protein
MTDQLNMPDPAVDKQLLTNLRRSRLELEELGLQLEEVIATLDRYYREKRRERLQSSVSGPVARG